MTDSFTEPHWDSSALVLIDLQFDFVESGRGPVEGGSGLVIGVIPAETAEVESAFGVLSSARPLDQ